MANLPGVKPQQVMLLHRSFAQDLPPNSPSMLLLHLFACMQFLYLDCLVLEVATVIDPM